MKDFEVIDWSPRVGLHLKALVFAEEEVGSNDYRYLYCQNRIVKEVGFHTAVGKFMPDVYCTQVTLCDFVVIPEFDKLLEK